MASTIATITLPNSSATATRAAVVLRQATSRLAGPDLPTASRLMMSSSSNIALPYACMKMRRSSLCLRVRSSSPPSSSTPEKLSEVVDDSIKNAQEVCAENAESGECAAAWDEVEEVSAAASDARDKMKAEKSDPLEAYCKDNPETDECRTYED